jgi:hypothetical protein
MTMPLTEYEDRRLHLDSDSTNLERCVVSVLHKVPDKFIVTETIDAGCPLSVIRLTCVMHYGQVVTHVVSIQNKAVVEYVLRFV